MGRSIEIIEKQLDSYLLLAELGVRKLTDREAELSEKAVANAKRNILARIKGRTLNPYFDDKDLK